MIEYQTVLMVDTDDELPPDEELLPVLEKE